MYISINIYRYLHVSICLSCISLHIKSSSFIFHHLSYITFIIYIKHLAEAVGIYKANKDLKKAVKYLVAQRFISDTPHEIANFLRVYKNKFDAGEML